MSDIWLEHMVKRKNILRISLVLLSNHEILQSNINTRFFYRPYSNTSYYSSFYLQNLGKTAKCSCWLKMLAITDLPVESPKNCALRDQPAGYEVTQGGSHAREAGSLEGSLRSCPLPVINLVICFREQGVIFFPLEPKKPEKNNA